MCSERLIALATAKVCLTFLARTNILPFIPTAISKEMPFPNVLSKEHLGFNNLLRVEIKLAECWSIIGEGNDSAYFLTWCSGTVKRNPLVGVNKPKPAFSPRELTHTSSGSMSLLANSSFANTKSPIWVQQGVRNDGWWEKSNFKMILHIVWVRNLLNLSVLRTRYSLSKLEVARNQKKCRHS